jgi:hypothetical protein
MLKPGQHYSGRRPDVRVINCTLTADAVAVLRLYCEPGRRALGKFVERLVYEHHARKQEQERIIGAIVSKN